LGSLRILAASRILFKGRVCPLSVEDDSPQDPLNSKQKRFTASAVSRLSSLTSVHLSNHHCCGALPPFSSYHPLSWTIVPLLQTSLHNELVGDGRHWRWRRDPAVVTRRSSRQTGMRLGNWDGLLPTGKTRQLTLSVSLNDIGESRCPVHFGSLSDADTLAPQVM
jgi:hypothetical protein